MQRYFIFIMMLFCIVFGFAEEIRVGCVGNSITSGASGNPETDPDTYPAQVGVLMGEGYYVRNFGVSGRTMLKKGDYPLWVEQTFSNAVAFKPDIVTILLGTNDSKSWNWEYKDEFVPDYNAMIDTFIAVNPDVQIYLCLPPPAFSVQWGITDSIITTDIIPMINQIAEDRELPVIDFYSAFSDKRDLFPDDIHPNKEGCWDMAKIIYNNLSGKQVEEIEEVNLALHKTVLTPKSSANPNFLVDGDIETGWPCSVDESFVIDVGAIDSIDMIQIIFAENGIAEYKIESGTNNVDYTLIVDQSARSDTSRVSIDTITPFEAQFIRFTLTGMSENSGSLNIVEMRILKKASIHAPVLTYEIKTVSTSSIRCSFIMTASVQGGAMKYYSRSSEDNPFTAPGGYRVTNADTMSVSVRSDQIKSYMVKFYKNSYEVMSDTLTIDYRILSNPEQGMIFPAEFNLYQNFPNPFNARTTISYNLFKDSNVKLTVYDIMGRKVNILIDGFQQSGYHRVSFNAGGLASSIYFYELETKNKILRKRMLLLK